MVQKEGMKVKVFVDKLKVRSLHYTNKESSEEESDSTSKEPVEEIHQTQKRMVAKT